MKLFDHHGSMDAVFFFLSISTFNYCRLQIGKSSAIKIEGVTAR